jgi:hypothetical protein
MAKYRLTNLLAREAADTAATKTVPLDLTDPVSRITVIFEGQNSSSTPLAHPAKMVSKIEVVDGSDVLMGLSGMQAQALDFYHTKKPAVQKLDYTDDNWQRQTFNLNFGRFLHDPRFILDPKRLKNPQLKITHNKALGGSTCNYGYLQVWADCFDEKPATPEGFLTAKEHHSYALGSGTYETIDMPVDYPYRMIMVRALEATYAIWELYSNIKFSSDQDKHVIFDGDTRYLLRMLLDQFGFYHETLQGTVGTGSTGFYLTPTSEANCVINKLGGSRDYFQAYQPWGGYCEVAAGGAAELFQLFMQGIAPHGALAIAMGDLQDPDDWMDLTNINSLKLRILSASGLSTGTTCDVVIQQSRKY